MKNYLSKEYRAYRSFSKEQKKVYWILGIVSAVLYILLAFSMFESLFVLCNGIGSIASGSPDVAIRDFLRMLPLFFVTGILTHLSIALVNVINETSAEKRASRIKKNSIEMIVIGAILFLYVIIMVIAKQYASLVEGYPFALFPLDGALFGLLAIILGVLGLLYLKKYLPKHPFVLPYQVNNKGIARRIFDRIFYVLFLLGSAYSFAALVQSTYIIDWTHGHIFYSLMLDLTFLIAVFEFIDYRYYFMGLKEEYRVDAEGKMGLYVLIHGVVVFILYILAFSLDHDAPNVACFGLLPVEYTASMNGATYLYILFNIVPGLVAFIKSIIDKKKAK